MMGYAAREQWANFAGGEFEHILSIDIDDPFAAQYNTWPMGPNQKRIINRNRSIVDAVNNAAKIAVGDLIIVMSDDFHAPVDWLKHLLEIYHETDPLKPFALLINDALQAQLTTMTLPIINKALYKRLGYIYYPDYFSVFADNDITDVCRKLNCLYTAPSFVFEHRHYINGKNKVDATYQRENSQSAFDIGKKVYDARKLRGFDI